MPERPQSAVVACHQLMGGSVLSGLLKGALEVAVLRPHDWQAQREGERNSVIPRSKRKREQEILYEEDCRREKSHSGPPPIGQWGS
jgi:hypothetical protein